MEQGFRHFFDQSMNEVTHAYLPDVEELRISANDEREMKAWGYGFETGYTGMSRNLREKDSEKRYGSFEPGPNHSLERAWWTVERIFAVWLIWSAGKCGELLVGVLYAVLC